MDCPLEAGYRHAQPDECCGCGRATGALVVNCDGTATLSGAPTNVGRKHAAGTYRDKIRATFRFTLSGGRTVSKTITQIFTITVG